MIKDQSIDILMITYNRPTYTRLALSRLLETCDNSMRVWIWQNGNDKATIDIVLSFKDHPNFYQYYHSPKNLKLTEPTNWLWEHSEASYFTKVDDDCIMPFGWAKTLRKAHEDISNLGIVGCWRFPEEDYIPEIAKKKIQTFEGNHRIMLNCWIEGSGYLMKRECYELAGKLNEKQSFPRYCINSVAHGFIVGWYYPFLYQKHLDDPRCEESQLKTNNDMKNWAPLSAINNGIVTVDAWQKQLKRSAHFLQKAPYDIRQYTGWRNNLRRVTGKIKRVIGLKSRW